MSIWEGGLPVPSKRADRAVLCQYGVGKTAFPRDREKPYRNVEGKRGGLQPSCSKFILEDNGGGHRDAFAFAGQKADQRHVIHIDDNAWSDAKVVRKSDEPSAN